LALSSSSSAYQSLLTSEKLLTKFNGFESHGQIPAVSFSLERPFFSAWNQLILVDFKVYQLPFVILPFVGPQKPLAVVSFIVSQSSALSFGAVIPILARAQKPLKRLFLKFFSLPSHY